jgi:site-specific DNA-cytosine methylase
MDGHVARRPRRDDAEFFALLGPGKRWMDYRSDNAPTIRQLKNVLEMIRSAVEDLPSELDESSTSPALAWLKKIDPVVLEQLGSSMDGSLSIRLLLENIEPHKGELQHHLLTEGYLAKRDGNHGDWVSRLDPDRPSRTIVSHMGKDTYAYVHPWQPRTLSVREAARVQSFPDWFSFRSVGFVDAMRIIGNAVPPFLSLQVASRFAAALTV